MKVKIAIRMIWKNKLVNLWMFLSMTLISITLSLTSAWYLATLNPNNDLIFSTFNRKKNNLILGDLVNGSQLQFLMILFFGFLLLVGTIYFSIKQEDKDWALLKLNSLNNKEIIEILLFRTLILNIIASVLGIFLSRFFIKAYVKFFFYFIFKPGYDSLLMVNLRPGLQSSVISLLAIFVMVIIASLTASINVIKTKPIDLFIKSNEIATLSKRNIILRAIIGLILFFIFLYYTLIKPVETGTIIDIQGVGALAIALVIIVVPILIPKFSSLIAKVLVLKNSALASYCRGRVLMNTQKNLSLATPILLAVIIPSIFALFSEVSVVRMNREYNAQNKKMGEGIYAIINPTKIDAYAQEKLLEIKGTQDLIITNTLSYYDAAEDDHYVGVNYINDKSLMVNLDLEAGSIDNISKNKIGASNDYELGDEIKITYYNGEEKTYNVVAVFKSVPYLLLPKIYIDYNSNEFLQGLEKIDNKLYMSNSSIGKAELEKKVKKILPSSRVLTGSEDVNEYLKNFSDHEFTTIKFLYFPCMILALVIIAQNIISLISFKEDDFKLLFRMGFTRGEIILENLVEILATIFSANIMIIMVISIMLVKFTKEFSINEITIGANLPIKVCLYLNIFFIIICIVITVIVCLLKTEKTKMVDRQI
ncbi:FtsX-like permease family protein [Peptoniphilus rhinitidis]|uniref:FtsX-like permease family protein n=1 Tax=Peptoniphilus rhinitidis TaxID=1175452 RepID=UPI0028FF1623|nr:FtsX-like permease family protein [Peptoniphilus rhinitidis]MDU1044217.1 ABC transporter permease [Peptoniphilus rhinitidis]MDU2110246.1 ABC transporter permease [Peptoniphilus lacydonensis]MDU3751646.1 ABC transporter permease [Peptoniphilus rhinitidis]